MRRHWMLVSFLTAIPLLAALLLSAYCFRYSLWQMGLPIVSDFDGESYLRDCVPNGIRRQYTGARIDSRFRPIGDPQVGLYYTPGGLGVVTQVHDGRATTVDDLPAP